MAPRVTVDELVATLQRSTLPSVIVEGKDDILAFRELEARYRHHFLSLIVAGDRSSVLSLFDRRSEFSNLPCAIFIVDRDMWLFSPVPPSYDRDELIITEGYSIENDLVSDYVTERLMTQVEMTSFASELETVLDWYSIVVSRRLAGEDEPIDVHPNQVLAQAAIGTSFLRSGELYPSSLRSMIGQDPRRYLRGKNFVHLLLRQLSRRDRSIKHSRLSLLEHAATSPGRCLSRIFHQVERVCGFG